MKEKNLPVIKGKKGDSAPARTPVEEPNTLQSRAIVRFVDLIGEGELEGLVNGEESVLFNNVPIRNASSEYNFSGVSIEFKPGAPDGVSLQDYPTSESQISVDVKLTVDAGWVTKNISDADIDDIILTFTIPSLFSVNSTNGDIRKTSVDWKVQIRQEGGSWQDVVNLSKYGKCVSSYQTDYRIVNLTRNYGAGPWDIRCLRITNDSNTNSLQNDIYWTSYTQVINRILIYPDTSLIGITLNAQQFGSRVPQRSYEVRGLRIQIPSNYNPETRSYSGIWDGTFQRAYSNNPAWVWYDVINNDRYGLGLDAEYIDKWTLYSISQYCDQLVPDGYGGYEPRFTFNGVLQSRNDAIHVLNMISSAFRAMPYWGGGKVSVSQDSPKTPVKIVTAANVVDGLFTYSYSPDDTRYTVCNVSWNDPDHGYKLQVESVDDKEGIERYGYRPVDVTAVGCTSRGQAYRFGRWFLYTSLYETETVSYRASWDHADVLPGEIITVMDNHEAATRYGGRVDSITSSSVTLDAGVTLEAGETYTVTCVSSDGDLLERDVTNSSDGLVHTTLNITPNWPAGTEPQVDSMWILSATNLVPVEYRVVTNTEVEPNIFEITAVIYDSNKYAQVEDGRVFAPAPITKVPDFNTPLAPPTNIQTELYTYEDTGGTSERADRKFGMLLSWTHTRDTRFQNYEIQWKISTGSFSDNETIKTTDTEYDIRPIESGVYTFRVRSTGLSWESDWLTLSEYTVDAVPDAPPQIQNLVVLNGDDDTTFNGKDCEIGWDALALATDTTSPAIYDGTAPTHAAPVYSKLTKLKDYQIEVLKTDDTHLRYEFVTENSFKYYFGMNQLDNGTPLRDLKFKVWARDVYDQLSNDSATIVVTNPAPDMSGLSQTVTDVFTGLKVDWRAITPSDNDLAKFRIYLDENNPPTTLAGEVSANTSSWLETGLTAEQTYRTQIEPYDEFGVGTKSNVVSGVPLKIAADDIDVELQSRLQITDSYDSTSSDFAWMYDHLTDAIAPTSDTYNSGDWIRVAFPTEQLVDRVSVWGTTGSIQCYVSVSDDQGTTWTYYKAEADHTLDSEGRLIEATNESDAQTNYWLANESSYSINIAQFPNGLAMTDCRFHFLNTVTLTELVFTDQVIAEWIVANQLSAISADLGTIAAGTLQSSNLSTTEGVYIDLNNETIKFGGTTDPSLEWDGDKVELNIADDGAINIGSGGNIDMGEGSQFSMQDGGVITVGSSIMLDSGPEDNDSQLVISEDTSVNADGRLELEGVDYLTMNQGALTNYYWDTSVNDHVPYKSLTRIETGIANNNKLTYIPGIFKDAPRVTVSPNVMPCYDKRYPNQSQTLNLEAADVTQYAPYKWRFRPKASLVLGTGVEGNAIEDSFYDHVTYWYNTSPALSVQSKQYSLGLNVRELTVTVDSIAYKYWTTRRRTNSGRDVTPTYSYYKYAQRGYWDVYLYYWRSGVWNSVMKAIRPGDGRTAASPVTSVLRTPKVSTDIRYFYVKGIYRGDYPSSYYGGGASGSGYSSLNRTRYININVKNSTGNLTSARLITAGTLNWTAIGV